jgi:hypothetical protein
MRYNFLKDEIIQKPYKLWEFYQVLEEEERKVIIQEFMDANPQVQEAEFDEIQYIPGRIVVKKYL